MIYPLEYLLSLWVDLTSLSLKKTKSQQCHMYVHLCMWHLCNTICRECFKQKFWPNLRNVHLYIRVLRNHTISVLLCSSRLRPCTHINGIFRVFVSRLVCLTGFWLSDVAFRWRLYHHLLLCAVRWHMYVWTRSKWCILWNTCRLCELIWHP